MGGGVVKLPDDAYISKRVMIQLIDPFGTPIGSMEFMVPAGAVMTLPEYHVAEVPTTTNPRLVYSLRMSVT